MSIDARSNSVRVALITGAIVWAAVVATNYLLFPRLEWIEVLFLFAAWVAAPVGFKLVQAADLSARRNSLSWILAQFAGAACATISFTQTPSMRAGLLALPWALNCIALSLDGLLRLLKYRLGSLSQVCFAVGEIYLTVGAAWLIASRLGMHPVGFEEPMVLLTAVHFHFAGFLSAVFAGLTAERLHARRRRGVLRALLIGVICGPALLAAGFVVGPRAKLLAAIVMTVGECGLAVGMMGAGARSGGSARWLLGAAGTCVLVAMGLAAAWAAGDFSMHAVVSLETMERVHGSLNALGFGGLGVLGWQICSGGVLRRRQYERRI